MDVVRSDVAHRTIPSQIKRRTLESAVLGFRQRLPSIAQSDIAQISRLWSSYGAPQCHRGIISRFLHRGNANFDGRHRRDPWVGHLPYVRTSLGSQIFLAHGSVRDLGRTVCCGPLILLSSQGFSPGPKEIESKKRGLRWLYRAYFCPVLLPVKLFSKCIGSRPKSAHKIVGDK